MLDQAIHRVKLVALLEDIFSNNLLGPVLGFKGGTALYLLHGLNRFSVDLDFDLLKTENVELVFNKLLAIAHKYGEIRESKIRNHSIVISLSYQLESVNLKIEVSTRGFGSSYELRNFNGISMMVMVPADIFAHKLVALTDRKKATNRDLYDIHWLLDQHWNINEEIIRKRTGLSLDNYIDKCLTHIQDVNQKHILSGIGDLITEQQKHWVKAHLIKELTLKLKARFNKLNC